MSETEVNRHAALQIPIASLPEDEEVAEKLYHSRIPGSNFIDRVGTPHSWDHNGELTTKSKNLQRELDRITDKAGSPVFTKGKAVELASDRQPVNEIQTRAAEVVAQLAARKAASASGGGAE